MARAMFSDVVLQRELDAGGNPIARPLQDVEVTVYAAGTFTVQTLYQSRTGGSTVTNPFQTDINGAAEFWMEPGDYDIAFHDTESPARISDKSIGWCSVPAGANAIPASYVGSGFDGAKISNNTIPGIALLAASVDLTKIGPDVLPPGLGPIPWSGAIGDIPTGWLYCGGQTVSTETYGALFDVIGTTYGTGGAGTFNLPDARGRVILPADDSASRVTGAVRNASGGAQNVTLSTTHMPSHNHGGTTGWADRDHTHTAQDTWTHNSGQRYDSGASGYVDYGVTSGYNTGGMSQNHLHGINAEGGGNAHDNLQPYIVIGGSIIKY